MMVSSFYNARKSVEVLKTVKVNKLMIYIRFNNSIRILGLYMSYLSSSICPLLHLSEKL